MSFSHATLVRNGDKRKGPPAVLSYEPAKGSFLAEVLVSLLLLISTGFKFF